MLLDILMSRSGKVFLFDKDFMQTLPIVPHDQRTAPADYCILYSQLWDHVQTLTLHQSMEVRRSFLSFL